MPRKPSKNYKPHIKKDTVKGEDVTLGRKNLKIQIIIALVAILSFAWIVVTFFLPDKKLGFDKEKFEVENEPGVIATNFVLNLKDSSDPMIIHEILNYGKMQIQTEKYAFAGIITEQPYSDSLYDIIMQKAVVYPYVTFLSNSGEIRIFHMKNLSRSDLEMIKEKKLNVFGFGSLLYKNPITKKRELFKYAVEFMSHDTIEYRQKLNIYQEL